MTVTGTGKARIAPDQIELTIELYDLNKDYLRMMEDADRHSAEVKSALTSAGFDRKCIKTSQFFVSQEYEWIKESNKDSGEESRKHVFKGFARTEKLVIRFDLDMKVLSKTMIALAQCDATPEFETKFTVKDKDAVSKILLIDATNNARSVAETLAEASKVRLGSLLSLSYCWGKIHLYSDTEYDGTRYKRVRAPEADFVQEDIKASDTVTFVWEIE
jgi:uncharacterized protein YggE